MRNVLAALALTLFAASPALAAHHNKVAGKTAVAGDAKPAEAAPADGTKTETKTETKTSKKKVTKKKMEKPADAPAPAAQ